MVQYEMCFTNEYTEEIIVDLAREMHLPYLREDFLIAWNERDTHSPKNIFMIKDKERFKGEPPANMIDPHVHHILFKIGNGAAQQELVKEGQEILRKYGIDPIVGEENLVWAPNRVAGQHDIAALKKWSKH